LLVFFLLSLINKTQGAPNPVSLALFGIIPLSEELAMRLVKNKASGKFFIVLDENDVRDAEFMVITPEGKVKQLEQHLFEPLDEIDPQDDRFTQRYTAAQLKKYREYLE
jgi:hypothetical protein